MSGESTVPGREQELQEVILAYLATRDGGEAVDREALLAQHLTLADDLRAFFADEDGIAPFMAGLRAPAAAPPSFGDYEGLVEIGRGGMGVVYRARQRSLNRI